MSDLNEIIQEVRKLSPEDRRQLLAELGESPAPLLSEKEFVTRLRTLGVLTTPESPDVPAGVPQDFQPAPTAGKPASQIIIEERR